MSSSHPQTRPETYGSRTQTITPTPATPSGEVDDNGAGPSRPPGVAGVLKLRGERNRQAKVVWSDEVVDNEGMGRKKSKICCIYHKPKAFDESSSESSSGSEDDTEDAFRQGKKDRRKERQEALRRQKDGGSAREELSSDESSSDGGTGDGKARPAGKARSRRRHHHHHHQHDHAPHGSDSGSHDCGGGHKVKPNKYDTQPRGVGKAVSRT